MVVSSKANELLNIIWSVLESGKPVIVVYQFYQILGKFHLRKISPFNKKIGYKSYTLYLLPTLVKWKWTYLAGQEFKIEFL